MTHLMDYYELLLIIMNIIIILMIMKQQNKQPNDKKYNRWQITWTFTKVCSFCWRLRLKGH